MSVVIPVITSYFIIGYKNDANLFFQFYFITFLLVSCQSALGQLSGGLFPNIVSAIQFIGTIGPLQFLFGGIFTRPTNIPIGWKWWYYMNPLPKSIISIALPQFECKLDNPYSIDSGCPVMFNPEINKVQTIHDYVQSTWQSGYEHAFSYNVGWLILTYVVTILLIVLSFRFINHLKR